MFKHRLSKFGKASLVAMSMLLVGGSFQSCEDDYFYDDKEPTWLGASIYDFLKTGSPGHTYANFVELIDSLGEKETLAHTGSKTLFVADDAAFERFYENNPWGVTSVSEMSRTQMKYLFYSSMLDNALLLDMLSSSGPKDEDEGLVLRRTTSFSVIDSVALVKGEEMPAFNQYWDALRGVERDASLRIAKDGTAPMMVHFLHDYLKNQNIKASDIEFLFKKDGVQTKTFTDDEALVFDKKLVASGISTDGYSDDTMTITCKNGYIYRLDDVLLAPSNMAEELRLREDTRLFSRMLDRFCIPVYDAALTAEYQAYHKTNDSIFRLRYFCKEEFESYTLLASKGISPQVLPYDPGSNTFGSQGDMAAMLVPKDEAFYQYFTEGTGAYLLERFAPSVEVVDIESLIQAVDSIPNLNISQLLGNLMQRSFKETVPSKFDKVKDDAHDEMGLEEKHIDESVIANNGVIYILNNVFGPADFRAVSAPTSVYENMKLTYLCIDELRYDYYLKAMDAEYSLIIPDNEYFVYHDPMTFSTAEPAVYAFRYDKLRPKGNGKSVELWAEKYKFNPATYEITDTLTDMNPVTVTDGVMGGAFNSNAFMKNRMTDIMEYLIIVHDAGDGIILPDGTLNPRKYYQSKGYGTMKVDTSDPDAIKFYGGEQIENGTAITVGSLHEQENGYAYCTVPYGDVSPMRKASAIPTPPTKSVYTNLLANSAEEGDIFHEFFELCMPDSLETTMTIMFPEAKTNAIKNDSMRLYSIFYSSSDGKLVNLVPFFNTFHYTVYVPSNEAIKEQIANGLPTWDDLGNTVNENPAKAAAMMRLLNNFLRYHFQDNSVYVDNVPFSIPSPAGGRYTEASFATAVINAKTGRFYETIVRNADDNSTVVVEDQLGNVAKILKAGEEGKTWNVMARDIEYSAKNNPNIATSSFSVIQPIDRALLNEGLFGYDGRYRRYSADGELVDLMPVATDEGEKSYLVANVGEYEMTALDGTEKMMRLAYLMSPLESSDEAYSAITREQLVYVDENKVLINNEGVRVKLVKDEDNNLTAQYDTVVAEDGNEYMIQVDNNGQEINRILVEVSAEPEN